MYLAQIIIIIIIIMMMMMMIRDIFFNKSV